MINVMLDDGAYKPTRAHDVDAGLDLYSREDAIIPAHGSHCFNTGVHVQIPKGYAGFLKSKSGLNIKRDTKSEGVIDTGYTGAIVAKLYNDGDNDFHVEAGDKITQLVLVAILLDDVCVVDSFEETERGDNGFGSTGVK